MLEKQEVSLNTAFELRLVHRQRVILTSSKVTVLDELDRLETFGAFDGRIPRCLDGFTAEKCQERNSKKPKQAKYYRRPHGGLVELAGFENPAQ